MRQSNIELCRIIAMMLVLTVHSSFATFGGPADWDEPYYGLIVAQSVGIVGVNVFVLISGYFSIKLRIQSVLRILYCCMFYGVVSSLYSYFNNSFSFKSILFVSEANWFITAYIGLMVMSPILNSFVDNSTKKTLRTTIVILLFFQTWYEFVPKLIPNFHGGYSILSFCILYLISRYLRLYPLKVNYIEKSWIIYLIITIILIISVTSFYFCGFKVKYLCGNIMKYNQPLIILSSVSLFLTFIKMKISYSPFINHLAKSCIAVLLIHTSLVFFPFFSNIFKYIFYHTSGMITVLLWFIAIVFIYILCAAFDQIRIFIEKKII
jgi:hypothetical protein